MQIEIIVKEVNRPSNKAVKEFIQYVFEVTKQHYPDRQQKQEEVTSHE